MTAPDVDVPVGIPVEDSIPGVVDDVPVGIAEESEPPPVDAWPPAAGSTLERTATGWIARVMFGGAIRLHGEGPTPEDAVRAAV